MHNSRCVVPVWEVWHSLRKRFQVFVWWNNFGLGKTHRWTFCFQAYELELQSLAHLYGPFYASFQPTRCKNLGSGSPYPVKKKIIISVFPFELLSIYVKYISVVEGFARAWDRYFNSSFRDIIRHPWPPRPFFFLSPLSWRSDPQISHAFPTAGSEARSWSMSTSSADARDE